MTPALMLLPNERRLHVRLATTSSAIIGFDSTALIPLRRWTHVAYVLKGAAALSLYVNGVKDCPHARGLRHGECPPGGATYAWDEGDVRHNDGPLYVGADPFMSGPCLTLPNPHHPARQRPAPRQPVRPHAWSAPPVVVHALVAAPCCAQAPPCSSTSSRFTTARCPSVTSS